MIRLSERDLARLLGNREAAAAGAPGARPRRARAARQPAAQVTEVAPGAEIVRGRAPRIAYDRPQVTVGFDLAPQPKERARTFVDDRALARAFAAAGGDARRFMASVKARGPDGEGRLMRSVTPEATRRFEEAAALVARRAMAEARLEPFTWPLEMLVEFRFEGDPLTWPTAHDDGDLDNLEKALKDSLNGVAYLDDRLIVMKTSLKSCAAAPSISMTLRAAPP